MSITGARDAIRHYKKGHKITEPIIVVFQGGLYEMKEPLVLLPEDSGSHEYPIIYTAADLINAAVMLEGARKITFLNCEISQTGQHAIWFGKGCSNS